MVDGTLVYAGRVGTGFDDAQLAELKAMLDPIVARIRRASGRCSLGQPTAARAEHSGDEDDDVGRAAYVCEVRFREWTPDGLLRHPAFLRMRPDKSPQDCDAAERA